MRGNAHSHIRTSALWVHTAGRWSTSLPPQHFKYCARWRTRKALWWLWLSTRNTNKHGQFTTENTHVKGRHSERAIHTRSGGLGLNVQLESMRPHLSSSELGHVLNGKELKAETSRPLSQQLANSLCLSPQTGNTHASSLDSTTPLHVHGHSHHMSVHIQIHSLLEE